VSFCFPPPGKRSGSLRIYFSPIRLVTGGEVSRVDPDSTGLNPAWRNSLVYTATGTGWEDGANSTQIEAARQLLIQDMKILEGIAPESGAYLNEVRITHLFHITFRSGFFLLFYKNSLTGRLWVRRLLDTNSTGRSPSSVLTTTSSEPSSENTIRNPSSSFTKALDQTSGTQISFAESETASDPHTWNWVARSSSTAVHNPRDSIRIILASLV